jgi:acyl-coenzyme A thioesterase PaaI-like protein
MASANRLSRIVAKLGAAPAALRPFLITTAFHSQVPFAGTGGIKFLTLEEGRAVLAIRNQRKVQNHIRGVHASAMCLLAETATGAVLGMTLPDDKIPLMKSMHLDFVRRAKGGLRAEATLTPEMRQRVLTEEKGDLAVPLRVTDEAGEEPVKCQMTWAWVPKKK